MNTENAAKVFGKEYPQEVELLKMTCEKFADMSSSFLLLSYIHILSLRLLLPFSFSTQIPSFLHL